MSDSDLQKKKGKEYVEIFFKNPATIEPTV